MPVKFSLGGDQGTNIFLPTSAPGSSNEACDLSQVDAIEQTITAGSSSLSYNPATGQYTYVWKTDKVWAGTCRLFSLRLKDGSTHVVHFNFTK